MPPKRKRRSPPQLIREETSRILGRLAELELVAGLVPPFGPRGKRVTLMFTDIEGFTAYAARKGDRAAVRLLQRHDKAVLPAIRGQRGRVVKRIGDGLMVAFPSADRAVKAALSMQRRLDGNKGISLRVGIHQGEAVNVRGDFIGHDVNVASRLADRARGRQILISEAARKSVDDKVRASFKKAGRLRLRGVAPIQLYRVEPTGSRA
jgi:adenylate cyclase